MMWLKKQIVNGLERACCVVDTVTPDWRWRLFPGRLCRLSEWSIALDDRWGTGHWRKGAS